MPVRRQFRIALATFCLGIALADPVNAADAVRVPDGFKATLYADDDLAHDVYSMTTDSLGRVVVSSRGYVRILIDADNDGRAESFKQFADGPKSGAQGMFFHGRDLLCTGDAGLIRYRDQNADDRADGPPDVFLRMKTGSEHHTHAVRRGPDGWWYVIAGNYAGITSKYATLSTSPIRSPDAGVLMRLKPDLSRGEIVADGYRNAYDFDFTAQGDVFVYDSDGERDVSLPWYRPTRVFQALPGSNAGFVSRSWKRPDDFLDMPPVLGRFGRGSPTGVVCYQHRMFPEKYRGAMFVLDWTFGRVIAMPLEQDGSVYQSEPIDFMTGVGQFGFAPTDAVVGPDGALYVSVGGRGTRGGVFRVTYIGGIEADSDSESAGEESVEGGSELTAILDAPQPSSAWSRAAWLPKAKQLGRDELTVAALNRKHSVQWRVRAIEIVTELYGGLDGGAVEVLGRAKEPEVRARAAWSHGRAHAAAPDARLLRPFLLDNDPLVARFALEALAGAGPQTDYDAILGALETLVGDDDRFVRQAAARVVSRLPADAAAKFAGQLRRAEPQAQVTAAWARLIERPRLSAAALETAMRVLEADLPDPLKLEAARLMQLALGDVGGGRGLPPVFDGYASRIDLSPHERRLDPFRIRLAGVFPTNDDWLNQELARLLAMLKPLNPAVLEELLARITSDSHPVEDIHYLIASSRIPIARSRSQQAAIARALVTLQPKIDARELNQDTNWDARVGEMYHALVEHDPGLPAAIVAQPEFGRPGHVVFLSEIEADLLPAAVDAFVRKIRADDLYPWTTDVVFVLGRSLRPEHRELVRDLYGDFNVQSAVLMVLAKRPEPRDRAKFIEGLESSQLEVLSACIDALEKLPPSSNPAEQFALLKTARRLGRADPEYPLRDKAVRLLQRDAGGSFGYDFNATGRRPQPDVFRQWSEWLAEKHPDEARKQSGGALEEFAALKKSLEQVNWDAGDADRGEKVFNNRACARCHGGRSALGPDLAGAAKRFSRDDLFTAVAVPDVDVSPRYQTTLIQTTAGKVYSGLVIYDSVDGLILRNSTGETFRIEANEIELRRTTNTSLMPRGLLKDLQPGDLADLYAYLRRLGSGEKR